MSIAKVIEVIAEGDSVDHAMQAAVRDASKSVRNIKHIYVEGIQGLVEDGEIAKVRINAKITFVIES